MWVVGGVSLPKRGESWGEENCRQFQQVKRLPLWNQCRKVANFMPDHGVASPAMGQHYGTPPRLPTTYCSVHFRDVQSPKATVCGCISKFSIFRVITSAKDVIFSSLLVCLSIC